MKTLFVCASSRINSHVGEEYDSILEVDDVPTTETIDKWASAIRNSILAASKEDKAAGGDGKVSVTLDGLSAYHAVLANYQVLLAGEVTIELPYYKEPTVTDSETLELINKYGKKG